MWLARTILSFLFVCALPVFADELHKIRFINHFDTNFQVQTDKKDSFVNFNVDTLYENEVLTLYLIPGRLAYLGFYIDENHSQYNPTEANAFLSVESLLRSEDKTYTLEVHGYIVGKKMSYSWQYDRDQTTITFCSQSAYVDNQGKCP